MNIIRFTFCIFLAAFIWGTGCTASKPISDPLAGWKFLFSQNREKLDRSIQEDYQDYIQKLPPEEKKFVGSIHLFEDGIGQHAVRIEVNLNGTRWCHVLIYDKDNKRIKVIKYAGGHYAC